MLYFYLKVAHILSMAFFFGAGAASAVLKIRADRSGDLPGMKFAAGHIVWADWLFTIPSGLALPITGYWMAWLAHMDVTTGWLAQAFILYLLAGLLWVPAAILQVKMRREIDSALSEGRELSPSYSRWSRIWLALGFPSFGAALFTVYIMVTKQAI